MKLGNTVFCLLLLGGLSTSCIREEVTNPTASEEWYTITVRALNPDMVGQTVRLGIAITPTWLAPGETTLLLINGLTDAIAWPDSGNMPEYIEIEQIPNPND